MSETTKINQILADVRAELITARSSYADFHSLHEAYAVIFEEMDELWDHVKEKHSEQPGVNARSECIQIAAMAIRTIIDRELV